MFKNALFALAICGTAAAASAAVTVYTNPASFSSVTGTLTTVGFDGNVAPTGFHGYPVNSGGYIDPTTKTYFTFNQAGAVINITGKDFYGTNFFPHDTLNASTSVSPSDLEVIGLPFPVMAFSIEFSSISGSSYTFHLSNGDQVTDASATSFGNVSFFGFTDTNPFSSLNINSTNAFIEDISFSTVPEPASLGMLGVGALTLLLRNAKKRN